ncbi:MAG TPA: class I SAM-dependent DNA methyltransferase [Anaerolineae bacterium]|nr:class I SAM-dependent DNA methyltransferase [Anaerolineae bacterium]HPL29010.1 class I SAM-dependent DNA methyltransferase [Anaerolineae bacterium]
MLSDPKLRAQVDGLWDKLWSGGLSNPLDAIEQLSYLIFFKRLDDAENQAERLAGLRGQQYTPRVPAEMRWGYWRHLEGAQALGHVRDRVFPWFRSLGGAGSSFERHMQNAEFKISKASLLIEACRLVDELEISAQNQDVQGDLFEHLLERLSIAGRNGQFRTPRHIIRLMVQMTDPKPGERIGDLAAGTAGFLVNAYQYILERHTSPEILSYDEAGWPHNLAGDLLTEEQRRYLQTEALRGYDSDSGMTMLRIGSMNLMLHGIEAPQYFWADTLAKAFEEARAYDVILMNPPFKGAVDKGDVSPTLPGNTTKTELLFLHLILRALDMGGRCAVIVPDGVLFGSSRAHVEVRKKLVEENRLDGVVSMPGGVFKPYAGVSTAVLLFTRGARTERIWFYDMAHDGFSLDDKRQPVATNDIPDILACWRQRHDGAFAEARAARLAALRAQVAPLKAERLELEAEIDRLRFEQAIAGEEEDLTGAGDGDLTGFRKPVRSRLAELEAELAPLVGQMERLGRQFWVTKAQVRANKYDLSASRYRQVEADEGYHVAPRVTIERLLRLEGAIAREARELDELLG